MAYSERVIDHYENPRNVGGFDAGDGSVGTGMVGAPACGDVMKLQIRVNPTTGLIEEDVYKRQSILTPRKHASSSRRPACSPSRVTVRVTAVAARRRLMAGPWGGRSAGASLVAATPVLSLIHI